MMVMVFFMLTILTIHVNAQTTHEHDDPSVSESTSHVDAADLIEWKEHAKHIDMTSQAINVQLTGVNLNLTAIGQVIQAERRELNRLKLLADAAVSSNHIDALINAADEQINYYAGAVGDVAVQIGALNTGSLRIDQFLFEVRANLLAFKADLAAEHHDHRYHSKDCKVLAAQAAKQQERDAWTHMIESRLLTLDGLIATSKEGVPNIQRSISLLQAELKQHSCAVEVWLDKLREALEGTVIPPVTPPHDH